MYNKKNKSTKNVNNYNKNYANTATENGTTSYKKSKFKNKKLLSSKENDIYLSNFLKKEINIEKKTKKIL